jgi:hypothetical protein
MVRRYPSRVLREELEALGVPRDEHDLVALSARFSFRLEHFEDVDETRSRLLISRCAARRDAAGSYAALLLPPRRGTERIDARGNAYERRQCNCC